MKKLLLTLSQKWPEYLLEILVLIIGIYGAFALDNWKEQSRNEQEARILLTDLRNDLEKTLEDFKEDTLSNSRVISNALLIEHYVTNDLPYSNELDSCFSSLSGWSSPFIITSAYQSLQSKGIDIIQNRSLRNSIVQLYDGSFSWIKDDYDHAEWVLYESVTVPFYTKNIRRINNSEYPRAIPNDFNALKQNEEFLNLLGQIIRLRKAGLMYYRSTMQQVENVITMIDKELTK